LYQEAYTPWEWHQPIFEEAKRLGIGAFSTAFDITAVDFLESIDTEAYKIASFECSDVRLLEAIASTGKPVIVSCGMAHLAEIELAINTLRAGGCQEIALLKCTSSYPADPGESNLKTIVDLKEKFNCEVGLSDHTLGTEVAIGAVALGATLIEKHFTLDKNDGAIDSDFSIEPRELARLVEATKTCWTALGEVSYGPTVSEEDSRRYRRSLYAAEAIQKGQRIQSKNLLSLRPSRGMDSQHINQVIGSRARNTIVAGQPIRKDDILFGSN
ncbi:MAG: pseudaminic acid synthase, partial [Coraliomargarita sp.]